MGKKGSTFGSKPEGLQNPPAASSRDAVSVQAEAGTEGVAWRRWRFGYMDGLRGFPSFIKCGPRTRPDAELISQKKQGGRATTSLVSSGNKSPASAAALRGAGVAFATLPRSFGGLK